MANPLSNAGISDRDYAAAVATAVGEAANQGVIGMAAVMDVVKNRLEAPSGYPYGTTIESQSTNPRQFSTWLTSEPSYKITRKVFDALTSGDTSSLTEREKAIVAQAEQAAIGVWGTGELAGVTQGATHYANKKTTDKLGTSGEMNVRERLSGKLDIGAHTFTGPYFDKDGNFDRADAEARSDALNYARTAYNPLSSIAPKANGTYDGGPQSAGMSYTPDLPGPMPGTNPMEPGFRFSSMPFGIGTPDPARSYDPLSSVRAPQAPAPQPGWGSIAGQATGAARPPVRDYGPDWSTPGPGIPATSTPDYTTGSNGTFQKTAPSTMQVPATKTYDPLSSIQAPAPAPVSAIPTFSSMKPKMAAVTAAVAAADEKAAAEAASEMDRETQRAKALGALPQDIPAAPAAKPVVKAPPPAPIQKPKLAPVPVAPPAPRENRAAKEPPSWNDPGATLRDQFGKPSDFMGTGVGASDFAKGVAAVAAINGDDKAKAYAGQLTSERPGISGVAFDALSNEYAKATGQAQTPTLYDRLASSTLGQAFGMTADIPAFNGYGASNSPKSQQGMFVQGADGNPTWANYSKEQQKANENASGFWGGVQNFFGFGPGADMGWAGVYGSSGPGGGRAVGPGTSDLY